jgi:hypothetical protein
MARRSNNTRNLGNDINNLFNITDPVQFEKALDKILKKYNKLLAIEKIREEYNRRTLNNTLVINSINDTILRKQIDQNKNLSNTLSLVTKISSGFAAGLNWLDSIDGVIKTANLSLGFTRGIAMEVRDNLIETAGFAAKIGASVKNVTEAQIAYNNSLGRNVILNKENLKSLISISRGLGLTNEFSGEIAGNFERIGYNAENTKDFIEDTIVSSGKFGVNVNKVMKTMNDGFQRANTFNFSKGITAFRGMVEYAEKFKINIESAFNSMEMARTLEGGIEMAAKLMVMGGEFSKTNPFELSFLARNRPEEFTKKMNEMTKGVYYFNQQTGQFQASAFELDRLRAVAEATGVPFGELNEQAMRLSQMNLAKSKLIGFSNEDKEFISSVADFNAKTGQFSISIDGNPVDIRKLTAGTLQGYKEMTKSLDQRAKDAMTFNESYTVFIEEFKSLFLPIIKRMNTFLTNAREFLGDTGTMIVGGIALLGPIVASFVAGVVKFGANIRNLIPSLNKGGSSTPTGGSALPQGSQGGKGFSFNATGAATALATGAAFLMVAKGVTMMAEAYDKLDTAKIDQLNMSLGIIGISGAAAAFAIGTIGAVSTTVAPALLALGASVALIGVGAMAMGKGIEFATNGFGNMISKFAELKDIDLLTMGLGVGAIAFGIAKFANPFTLLGMAGFGTFIGLLSTAKKPISDFSNMIGGLNTLNADYSGINNMLSTFQKVTTSDNGIFSELKEVIAEINKIGNNMGWIKELKDTLSKPLKVEFDRSSMSQAIDLKVFIDSEQIYRKTLTRLPKDINMMDNNRLNNSKLKTYYNQ